MSKGRFNDLFKSRRDRRRASPRSLVSRSLGPESLELEPEPDSCSVRPARSRPFGSRPLASASAATVVPSRTSAPEVRACFSRRSSKTERSTWKAVVSRV